MKVTPSQSFERSYKKYRKKRPQIVDDIKDVITQLGKDHYHPSLKTHQLKGKMKHLHSCSVSYQIRMIFQIVSDTEIVLVSLNDHDQYE